MCCNHCITISLSSQRRLDKQRSTTCAAWFWTCQKEKSAKIFEDKERRATYQSGEQQSQVKPKCKTVTQNLGWESPRLRFFYYNDDRSQQWISHTSFSYCFFFQSYHGWCSGRLKNAQFACTLLTPMSATPTDSFRFWPPDRVLANAFRFSSRPSCSM